MWEKKITIFVVVICKTFKMFEEWIMINCIVELFSEKEAFGWICKMFENVYQILQCILRHKMNTFILKTFTPAKQNHISWRANLDSENKQINLRVCVCARGGNHREKFYFPRKFERERGEKKTVNYFFFISSIQRMIVSQSDRSIAFRFPLLRTMKMYFMDLNCSTSSIVGRMDNVRAIHHPLFLLFIYFVINVTGRKSILSMQIYNG